MSDFRTDTIADVQSARASLALNTRCCSVCGKEADTRPYGAGGSLICFDCMKASPEREAQAKRQFVAHLNAIDEPDIVLTPAGPVGASHITGEGGSNG